MRIDIGFRDRRTSRLKGFDYSQTGYYFVTVCAHMRRCVFGAIEEGKHLPSPLGQLVIECWQEIPHHFANVELDFFTLMPNHFHGILWKRRSGESSLMTIVNSFKSAVTKNARQRNLQGQEPVWQRSFHDHVIRRESSLIAIRQYIADNPVQWAVDELNPSSF